MSYVVLTCCMKFLMKDPSRIFTELLLLADGGRAQWETLIRRRHAGRSHRTLPHRRRLKTLPVGVREACVVSKVPIMPLSEQIFSGRLKRFDKAVYLVNVRRLVELSHDFLVKIVIGWQPAGKGLLGNGQRPPVVFETARRLDTNHLLSFVLKLFLSRAATELS